MNMEPEKAATQTVSRPLTPGRLSRLGRVNLALMLAGLALLLVLGGVSAATPADLPETVAYNQAVADVLSQVTTQTLGYELAGLSGERPVTVAGSLYTIATRNTYYTHQISMATRYAYEQLARFGLVVTYHNYVWSGYQLRNVVAEKPGLVDSDEIYLIAAHMDDMPKAPLAPGADDNGSGSVAVLMVARLLAPHHFAHTIRFVLFTSEEQGLGGSDAYAADCAARAEDIQGVVNLDMIGYNTGEPWFDAYARSGSAPGAPESRRLADVFSDVVGIYDLDLVPRRIDTDDYPLKQGSDQWSFLSRGYPAIVVAEDYAGGDFTPYYHTTGDRLDTLDLVYWRDLTRAAIATIAHLGQPLPVASLGQLSGAVTGVDTGHPLSGTTVAAFWPVYSYTFTTPTDAGGAYSLSLPVGSYTLTVWPASLGYYATAVTGVSVITNTVTVQDVALEPWPRLYLPWIVRECQSEPCEG